MNPRMQITWQVLEAAIDAGDDMLIEVCRRIIRADRLGWEKHGHAEDFRLVLAFLND